MVEQEEGEFHDALRNIVADYLHISNFISRLPDADEDSDYLDFVDEVLIEGSNRYYISVKNMLSQNDIARAYLAKGLMDQNNRDRSTVEIILMAKKIPARVKEISDQLGITIIQLDWDFPIPARKSPSKNRISKLSHPTSWRIVTRLLFSGPSSIRKLSKEEGVSYSWAHATVTRLIDMGVAERTSMGVEVVDIDRLMDGISWERPFNRLLLDEIPIEGDDYMEAARDIGNTLNHWNLRHAYTAFTAGGLYTGHSQRFDKLYIYIEKRSLNDIRGSLYTEGGNLALNVYRSDRRVFQNTQEIENLILTTPSTTLLDLIGLGFKARTIAREMVNIYAETAHE